MAKRPNIILVMTDQQRWDTIAAYGWPGILTPNLDILCEQGTAFKNAYAQATVGGPARNSVVCSRYVHSHGVERNESWIPYSLPNWIQTLRASGYHTANIGKMHTAPLRLECGFDHRVVVENKNYEQGRMGPPDDYDLYLKKHGHFRPAQRYFETEENWYDNLGAALWPYDDDLYPDNYIGRHSCEYIETYDFDNPLFLWTGFAGPHDPYDVPSDTLERYAGVSLPGSVSAPNERDTKPPEHQAAMDRMDGRTGHAAIWRSRATEERIDRMRRHYCANVSLIDDWVGRIRGSLERAGQMENTIMVFTSDHGDYLGDHNMVYKFWAHYDPIVKVPLIVCGAPVLPGRLRDDLVEAIDIGPTILDLAKAPKLPGAQGLSLRPLLTNGKTNGRDAVFSEQGHRMMVRTDDLKMVYYAGKPYGEMYRMDQDPDELINLYNSPDLMTSQTDLTTRLLDWQSDTRFRRD